MDELDIDPTIELSCRCLKAWDCTKCNEFSAVCAVKFVLVFSFVFMYIMPSFLAWSFLSFTFFPFLSALPQTPPPSLCNGQASLCAQKYSNISQIGTHDSPFVGDLPQDNQHLTITQQLDAGVRFLQAQTHLDLTRSLNLCHTSCFLADAGTVEAYLATVKTWLDAHPAEVVTVLLTNGDNVDVSMFDDAFTKSGIKPYAFIPATAPDPLPIDSWPTLADLIAANTRLITFLGPYSPSLPSQNPI